MGLGVSQEGVTRVCLCVSTCAHRHMYLCVQETRCGGQSLGRHYGLSLRWNSLSVSADARREALWGGDWGTARQPKVGSQDRCSAT